MDYWIVSKDTDKTALSIVDGLGRFSQYGPHYSRRRPGSKRFVGVGRKIVLLSITGDAVWSVVYQRTPSPPGAPSTDQPFVWRNNVFRNLGNARSSDLIASATELTYGLWKLIYGSLPSVPLRTEVDSRKVISSNPGYCYIQAGWVRARIVRRHMHHLIAPEHVE